MDEIAMQNQYNILYRKEEREMNVFATRRASA
jgi:aryl-alcohol dehydrogenase-like predicted oxidoreductase